MFKKKIPRLIKKIYPAYGLQKNDIILASFPKSGNTWMRFIWFNIISIFEFDENTIDFHELAGRFCANYDHHDYGSAKYNSLPRLVKTHREYHPAFKNQRKIYLYRDPKDVMVSYFYYQLGRRDQENKFNDISIFIRSQNFGIEAWCRNFKSWQGKYDIAISYEDLKKSEEEIFRRIFQQFGISNISQKILNKAIDNSKFDKLKKIEEKRSRPSVEEKRFNEDHKFMRKGEKGSWKQIIKNNDVDYIKSMLDKYHIHL